MRNLNEKIDSQASRGETKQDKPFVLQDSRSLLGSVMMFWRDGGGYTSDLSKAEKFTKDSALAQHSCRSSDVPWPLDYLAERAKPAIDMQLLRNEYAKVQKSTPADTPAVLTVGGAYDGNSVFFTCKEDEKNDDRTKNLDKAYVYSAGSLYSIADIPGYNAPKALILEDLRKIQFMVVNAKDCNKAQSLDSKYKPRKCKEAGIS